MMSASNRYVHNYGLVRRDIVSKGTGNDHGDGQRLKCGALVPFTTRGLGQDHRSGTRPKPAQNFFAGMM